IASAVLIAASCRGSVAIHQGEVVDYDIDDEDLIDRRVEKYGKKIVLIRHVDSDPDEVITIRSHIIL
ncbi:MAG: hypothetical protein AAF639_36430, partial [Chloroflexota bacterium]